MATVEKPPIAAWPDHTQLPESNGEFVKNFQEHPQSVLLTESIRPLLDRRHPDGQYAIGQDSGIYWRMAEPPDRGCVAPDWFYVPDVPPMLDGRLRRSYVMWQELLAPLIVLEFVSGDGSEERDRTPLSGKFWIYERVIRPSYYGIFEAGRIEMHHLVDGRFQPLAANGRGHYPIDVLGIEVGLWRATYQGMDLPWVRWFDAGGAMIPTGSERADREAERAGREAERAEREAERVDKAAERAERLAARLRELGIEPDA